MGPERLSLRHLLSALVLSVSAASCAGSKVSGPAPRADVDARPRHLQIVHAMTTPQRRALVDQLRARNPAPPASQWTVNEDALARSMTVVDPFAGFLRRARRGNAEPSARARGPIDEAEASASAREFVKRNADLLGLPRHVVPGLAEHTRSVVPSDHVSPRTTWAVRFDASFATKGYEGFDELRNHADLEIFVDDDGEVSSFVNLSRVHPHLAIDTKPGLAQDDPRLIATLVGRKVFVLDADESSDSVFRDPRDLRRIPLGEVQPADVTRVQLVIHVATGPQLAWLTYRLGYFVEIAKPAPVEATGEDPSPGGPPQYFFFRWVVDADTGDVLEDARVPFSAPAVLGP